MSAFEKLLEKLVDRKADTGFAFTDLCYILRNCGFEEHTRGSHHIFSREGVEEQLNLQKWHGSKDAKPYQVRQVRNVLLKYDFGREP